LKLAEERQEILAHHAAHHAADASFVCGVIGVGDEDLAHDAPIAPVGSGVRAAGAFENRTPVSSDVGRTEIEAERNEATLTCELERLGAGADASDADGRMPVSGTLDVMLQRIEHRAGTLTFQYLPA